MGGMTAPPRAVVRAAQALGLDPAGLRSLGGAASAVLPGPAVLDRAEVDGDVAVRLERRPGRPVVEVLQQHPGLAHIREAYEGLRQRTAST